MIFHNNKAIQCRFTTWVSLLFVAIFLQLLNMIRPKQVFNPFIAVYADSAWIEKIIRCICWYFEWNDDRIWVFVIINQAGIRNYNSWLSPLISKCVIFPNGRIFMTVFRKSTWHSKLNCWMRRSSWYILNWHDSSTICNVFKQCDLMNQHTKCSAIVNVFASLCSIRLDFP